MWKTTNYNGEQVWYSEEEYKLLQQENEELKNENHYLREGLERQVCFTTNAEVYAEKCHETLEEIKAMTNIDCKECVQIIDKINLFINENG